MDPGAQRAFPYRLLLKHWQPQSLIWNSISRFPNYLLASIK